VSTFAVVAGGGTAGHVLPAIAVAESLVATGRPPSTVHYVGAERGVETRLLPPTPFPHTFLDVVGLQRSLSRRNLSFVPKMRRARRDAIALLERLQPEVVVSVGGYASVPAVLAARHHRIPIVVVSYDRTPGRASRLAARWAIACAVAFDGSPLPRAVVTGAPVRRELLALDRARDRPSARHRLGIAEDRFVIGVMGGSLGSRDLNEAVTRYAEDRRDDDRLVIHHVVGERFLTPSAEPRARTGVDHRLVGYQADMAALYAGCDLFVGRGGASTVHEVAVTGTPAVLVPWAGAADDHQTDNVRWLTEVGGAVSIESYADAPDLATRLGAELDRLRADDDARRALGAAAWRRGAVDRSDALATLIEEVAVDGRNR
jgi:UDP-N-acetylglucosamine:LPS N-acetylglucosamine transferase